MKSSQVGHGKKSRWSEVGGWMDGGLLLCSLVAPSRSSSVIIIASQCAPRWVNHAFRAAHIEKNNNPRRKQPSLVICRLRFLDSTLVMCSRALQTFTGAIWLWFRNFSKIKIATHKQRMHSGSPTHANLRFVSSLNYAFSKPKSRQTNLMSCIAYAQQWHSVFTVCCQQISYFWGLSAKLVCLEVAHMVPFSNLLGQLEW